MTFESIKNEITPRDAAVAELVEEFGPHEDARIKAATIVEERWDQASKLYDEEMARLDLESKEVTKAAGTLSFENFQELHASNYQSLWNRIDDIFAVGQDSGPTISSKTARGLTIELVKSKGYK